MYRGLSKKNYPGKMSEEVSVSSLPLYNPIKHYDSSYYLGTYRQMDAAFVVEQLYQLEVGRSYTVG